MPDPVSSFLAATEVQRLRAENAELRRTNLRLVKALSFAVCQVIGHPGTDRLVADLFHPSEEPPARTAEGPIPPDRTTP